MKKTVQRDMTKGSPTRIILGFTLPLFLGNVFQQFYNMADTIIVGQFVGTGALAAVGSTGTIMFLITGFATGLGTGFTILTAQRFGAGDMKGMRRSVFTAAVLTVIVSVLVTAVSVIFMHPLLDLMQTPADIYDDAYAYIIVIMWGLAAQMLYNLLSALLRAIGNSKMPHHRSTTTFFDGIAWLAQLVMFLTLGLLVNPTELLPVAGIGLLIAVAMILIARPATVYLCLLPFRKISGRAKAYVSWVGLRGAVPIIFATYPLIAGINNANLIFNIVFFITIMSLVIQGTTVGYMAGKLRMVDDSEPAALSFSFEELPDEIKSTLSETEVTADMLASGDRLMDLPLPDDELVVTVKRDGAFFIPNGRSKLCLGDKLLVISHSERGQILQTK